MTEDGSLSPFRSQPGQYLTLALQSPTGPKRRFYTIASSPNQSRFLELTIKREDSGSAFLHDHVQGRYSAGLWAASDFTFTGTEANYIVMAAGGVGATPMMCKLRHLTKSAWKHSITLIYCVQTLNAVIFSDEQSRLQTFTAISIYISCRPLRTPGHHAMDPYPRCPHRVCARDLRMPRPPLRANADDECGLTHAV